MNGHAVTQAIGGNKCSLEFGAAALAAVLGVLACSQAGAEVGERAPPNGANGTSLNGLAINGMTINGMTINGMTINGLATNGVAPDGKTVPVRSVVLQDGSVASVR